MLKLFRGFAAMSEEMLSKEWRNKLFSLLEDYITKVESLTDSSKDDSRKILPRMWLSVIEMCQRNGRSDLARQAKEKFEEAYDW